MSAEIKKDIYIDVTVYGQNDAPDGSVNVERDVVISVVHDYFSENRDEIIEPVMTRYEELEAEFANAEADRNTAEQQRKQNDEARNDSESSREDAEAIRISYEESRIQNEISRIDAETERAIGEINRNSSELTRADNESKRIESESARSQNEISRQTFETARQISESYRKTGEESRIQSEETRTQNEASRITAELARQDNEESRQASELERASSEEARKASEVNREDAEKVRVANENQRVSFESARHKSETGRETAESLRVTAETARQTAETIRQTSEATRVTEFDQIKKSAEEKMAELDGYSDSLNKLNDELSELGVRVKTLEDATPSASGGGLSVGAINSLISILRNAYYREDFDSNTAISTLATQLVVGGGGEEDPADPTPQPTYYSVSQNLTNVDTSNNAVTVKEGISFTTTLSVGDNYTLDAVSVLMGDIDVTGDVYNRETGVIYIASVTGNIIITANASENVADWNMVQRVFGVDNIISGNNKIVDSGRDLFGHVLYIAYYNTSAYQSGKTRIGYTDTGSSGKTVTGDQLQSGDSSASGYYIKKFDFSEIPDYSNMENQWFGSSLSTAHNGAMPDDTYSHQWYVSVDVPITDDMLVLKEGLKP